MSYHDWRELARGLHRLAGRALALDRGPADIGVLVAQIVLDLFVVDVV